MPRRYTFRKISKTNLAWHPELGEEENAKGYADWLWLDGQLEGDYQYSMGMFGARPGIEGTVPGGPTIELHILTPDGKTHHGSETFPPESFKPEAFGAAWGDNKFAGKLKPDGVPEGYDLKVSVGDVGVDLSARTVATGLVFSDEEHGYTYYHPGRKTALAWWPLVPRAEVEGTLTIEGKPVKVSGLSYVERQITNIPQSFGGVGQSWWTWGHFYAGDFTAVWTDSAASAHYQYRHFSPFALWKGSELVLSSFQFTAYIEQYGIDPDSGALYPVVESLRASDGNVELRAQLLPGKINHVFRLGGTGVYCRQYSPVNMQLRRWDDVEEASGTAVHEFGAGGGWFPFDRLK